LNAFTCLALSASINWPDRPYNLFVKRVVLNLFSVLSLLLCVAALSLWIRSYRIEDDFYASAGGMPRKTQRVISSRGGLLIQWRQEEWWALSGNVNLKRFRSWRHYDAHPYPYYRPSYPPPPSYTRVIQVAGFEVAFPKTSKNFGSFLERTFSVTLPLPFLAGIFALPPALGLRSYLRRRKPRHCPRCGYDLRATPTLCPECGYNPARAHEE